MGTQHFGLFFDVDSRGRKLSALRDEERRREALGLPTWEREEEWRGVGNCHYQLGRHWQWALANCHGRGEGRPAEGRSVTCKQASRRARHNSQRDSRAGGPCRVRNWRREFMAYFQFYSGISERTVPPGLPLYLTSRRGNRFSRFGVLPRPPRMH